MSDFLTNWVADEQESYHRQEDHNKIYHAPRRVDDTIHVVVKMRGHQDVAIDVPRFKKSATLMLNKSAIFYGSSGTGKTILMKDFMFLMRKLFPIVFVFAPTNYEKNDFAKILPSPLIYEDFGIDDIRRIYLRQREAARHYNNANKIDVLRNLFSRIADKKSQQFIDRLELLREKAQQKIEETYSTDLAVRREKLEEINDLFHAKITQFYKQIIKARVNYIDRSTLSVDERAAIKFINFISRLLIMFDDAGTELISLIKADSNTKATKKVKEAGDTQNGEVIKNFFFKGRHSHMTHWYAFQEDTNLDTGIRRGAFYSFFTDKQTALAFFNKSGNGFTAVEKRQSEAIINAVFSDAAPKWAKLVYVKLEKKFYYIVADQHEDFEMCSQLTRRYCTQITSKSPMVDTSNPYFERFTADIDQ